MERSDMNWTRIIIDVIVGIYWYRQGLKDGKAGL